MKTIHVLGNVLNNTEYDYFITEQQTDKGRLYELCFSNDQQWNQEDRCEVQLSILDTGNGYQMNPAIPEDPDYTQICHLFILLTYINKVQPIYSGYMAEITAIHEF